MISANQFKLDWDHFNDIHSDKETTFENLCRSLFCRKIASRDEVIHSNPNHPGVEVSPVLSMDGSKMVSFQAKYFKYKINYTKIKKSIKLAIKYYKGTLDIIYLYCNIDVTSTSNSYIEIENMLSDVGISLIPITGQSILNDALDYPPILACYFGLDSIDKNWFDKNLQMSLDNLGRRYNHVFNIDTDAKKKMSLFLNNSECISILNKKKNDVIESLEEIRWRVMKIIKV